MTDHASTADTGDPAEIADTAHEGGADNTPDTSDGGNREAARYRRRLRDAEAERDQLGQRLTALQRIQAERLAGECLVDGADIWRDGVELAALLDDDGNLDPDKVTEHAAATAATHPHWQRRQPPQQIKRGSLASGASTAGDRVTPTWSSVLRGGAR